MHGLTLPPQQPTRFVGMLGEKGADVVGTVQIGTPGDPYRLQHVKIPLRPLRIRIELGNLNSRIWLSVLHSKPPRLEDAIHQFIRGFKRKTCKNDAFPLYSPPSLSYEVLLNTMLCKKETPPCLIHGLD